MTVRRTAIVIAAAAAGLVLLAVVALWPISGLMLRLMVEGFFPSTIPWEGKSAWKRCDSAIAGRTSWPSSPAGACAAMHLCANEAPLSEPQEAALLRAIHATPGCEEP